MVSGRFVADHATASTRIVARSCSLRFAIAVVTLRSGAIVQPQETTALNRSFGFGAGDLVTGRFCGRDYPACACR